MQCANLVHGSKVCHPHEKYLYPNDIAETHVSFGKDRPKISKHLLSLGPDVAFHKCSIPWVEGYLA